MEAILAQLLNGLDKGGAYALIALGLTVALTAWLTGRYTSRPRRRLAPPAPGAPPGRPARGTSPASEAEGEKRTRGRV